MLSGLILERRASGLHFPDGTQHFYNAAGDRRLTTCQAHNPFEGGIYRSVNLSSLVAVIRREDHGYNQKIWVSHMRYTVTEREETLTVDVPDFTLNGGVSITIEYDEKGIKSPKATGGMDIGGGLYVVKMRERMLERGHYHLDQLPPRINFALTVETFLDQMKRGDYDSVPPLIVD